MRAYSRESYDLNCAYISRITDWTFVNSDRALATYSALDNHLLITDLASGHTLYSTKAPLFEGGILEGISQAHDGSLAILTLDKETQSKYTLSVIMAWGEKPIVIHGDMPVKEGDRQYRYAMAEGALMRLEVANADGGAT